MRKRLFVLLGVIALQGPASASQTCYVDFINDAQDSVVSVEHADAGSAAWTSVELGGPLQGGYAGQATVAFHVGQDALRDLLIEFADGKILEVTKFDVCRLHSLYIDRTWTAAVLHQPRQ